MLVLRASRKSLYEELKVNNSNTSDFSFCISGLLIYQPMQVMSLTVADPGFPVAGCRAVGEGTDLRREHFSAKIYAKTKELDPVAPKLHKLKSHFLVRYMKCEIHMKCEMYTQSQLSHCELTVKVLFSRNFQKFILVYFRKQ